MTGKLLSVGSSGCCRWPLEQVVSCILGGVVLTRCCVLGGECDVAPSCSRGCVVIDVVGVVGIDDIVGIGGIVGIVVVGIVGIVVSLIRIVVIVIVVVGVD